jgi:hypothetical protein
MDERFNQGSGREAMLGCGDVLGRCGAGAGRVNAEGAEDAEDAEGAEGAEDAEGAEIGEFSFEFGAAGIGF